MFAFYLLSVLCCFLLSVDQMRLLQEDINQYALESDDMQDANQRAIEELKHQHELAISEIAMKAEKKVIDEAVSTVVNDAIL